MKKLWLDRITIDPEVMGGQPCIRGLKILVSLIIQVGRVWKTTKTFFQLLPFIIEKSSSLQNIFFSEPFMSMTTTFITILIILYLSIKNTFASYKIYIVAIPVVSIFSMHIFSYSLADKNRRLSALIASVIYSIN